MSIGSTKPVPVTYSDTFTTTALANKKLKTFDAHHILKSASLASIGCFANLAAQDITTYLLNNSKLGNDLDPQTRIALSSVIGSVVQTSITSGGLDSPLGLIQLAQAPLELAAKKLGYAQLTPIIKLISPILATASFTIVATTAPCSAPTIGLVLLATGATALKAESSYNQIKEKTHKILSKYVFNRQNNEIVPVDINNPHDNPQIRIPMEERELPFIANPSHQINLAAPFQPGRFPDRRDHESLV